MATYHIPLFNENNYRFLRGEIFASAFSLMKQKKIILKKIRLSYRTSAFFIIFFLT